MHPTQTQAKNILNTRNIRRIRNTQHIQNIPRFPITRDILSTQSIRYIRSRLYLLAPPTPSEPPTPPTPPTPPEPDKPITIIVNAEDKILPAGIKTITYQGVVEVAYGTYNSSDQVIYTVVYSNGPAENPKGTLVLDQSVKVKEGMIFNVGRSDKS